VNWANTPVYSVLQMYIPPEARWYFVGALVLFIVAIHIHAINRD